jgi:hypothetical protein
MAGLFDSTANIVTRISVHAAFREMIDRSDPDPYNCRFRPGKTQAADKIH